MDGEDSPDLRLSGQKQRYQAGMPIIGMDNVRLPFVADPVGDCGRDVIEQGKSNSVVLPFLTMLILIRATWPIEKTRTVDQPDRNLRLRQASFEKPCLPMSTEVPEMGDLRQVRGPLQRLP